MPIARYFLLVGGVLLALLFVSDAYLPKLPVAHSVKAGLPLIRISTDRKWPERVVFDTSRPTIAPAQIANTDAGVEVPAAVADVAPKTHVREAFGQMQPSDPQQLQSEPKKPEAKLQRKRNISKRRAAPPMVLVARQPQFGWFSSKIW